MIGELVGKTGSITRTIADLLWSQEGLKKGQSLVPVEWLQSLAVL